MPALSQRFVMGLQLEGSVESGAELPTWLEQALTVLRDDVDLASRLPTLADGRIWGDAMD